jgi:membrane protein
VVIAVVISLWSASSAMSVLQSGLDVAYGVPEPRRGMARQAMALVLMVVVGAGVVIVAGLAVFGQPLGQLVNDHLGNSTRVFVPAWTALRWVVTAVVAVVVIGLVYRLGTRRPAPRARWLTPGVILAGAGWLALSLALSYYVTSFGHYGRTYGALAGVVVLMLWLYLSSLVVLFGAHFNAELERSAAAAGVDRGGPVPAPASQPGPPAAPSTLTRPVPVGVPASQ